MTVGENIIRLRKKAGITSRELALRAGVTPATMSRYEHGQISAIPTATIGKIAGALGVSAEELTSGDPAYSFMGRADDEKISPRKKEERELLKGFYGLSSELQDAVRKICNTGLSK